MATKKVVIDLRRKKKKHPMKESARAVLRARMQTPAFANNRKPGHENGNPEGHNQYTHPRAAKRITEAIRVRMEQRAPDEVALAVGLEPGATWADCIGEGVLFDAARGILDHVQYAQDASEDKMSGPGGKNAGGLPPAPRIEFVMTGKEKQ